jgi:catalase
MDLSQEIADVMIQAAGNRPVHSKGIVYRGTFAASPGAAEVSCAAHFRGAAIPVTVRFSDSAPAPSVADNAPEAAPRGIAIRFTLPDGKETDIVAISHNGFVRTDGPSKLAWAAIRRL